MSLLTAPVKRVNSRLHAPWLNVLMVSLPSLAVLGSQSGWLGLLVFRVAVAGLLVVAAFDWARHRDRSRTGWAVWGLAAMFAISAVISIAVWRPDLTKARVELVAVAVLFEAALALVQLYRGRPTLIGLCRGWLAALGLILAAYLGEVLTGDRFRSTPDPTTWFPDVAQLVGAVLMALLFIPVGIAIEPKRWVRGLYLGLTALTAIVALVPPGPHIVAQAWRSLHIGGEPNQSTPVDLLRLGWWMLRDSNFLGTGPGTFETVLASGRAPFVLPWGTQSHWAVAEVMGQYGLGVSIVLTLALIGLARRGIQRLNRTPGLPLWSPKRAPAVWVLVVVALWPILSMAGAAWFTQPVAAMQVATIACLARHLERPKGRRPGDANEPELA